MNTRNLCCRYISAYLLIYLLTPWSRVLLEKLTDSQLVKKFPAFYGTRRFMTAFASARHLSLSCARSIQSIPRHPTSCGSISILSSLLSLDFPGGLFPCIYLQDLKISRNSAFRIMGLVKFYGPRLCLRVCVCFFNGIVLFSCSRTLSCTFIYKAQGLLAIS